jgi:hypothetical protein
MRRQPLSEIVGMIIALSLGWSDLGQIALARGTAHAPVHECH